MCWDQRPLWNDDNGNTWTSPPSVSFCAPLFSMVTMKSPLSILFLHKLKIYMNNVCTKVLIYDNFRVKNVALVMNYGLDAATCTVTNIIALDLM